MEDAASGVANRKVQPGSRQRSDSIEKRKRESLESQKEEIFKKSKRIPRSPVRKQIFTKSEKSEPSEEEMDELKTMISCLTTKIDGMNSQISKNHKELKNEVQNNSNIIEKLKKEQEERDTVWQKEKELMKKEINILRRRLEEQDKRSRANNILIKGMDHAGIRTKDAVENLLGKELNVSCKVKSVTEIKNRGENPMLLVELDSKEEKRNVMMNKNKLKGKMIYVDNDWTKEERKMSYVIRKKAAEKRRENKNVKIFYNKLVVDDKQWVWNEEKEDLEEQEIEKGRPTQEMALTSRSSKN